METGLGLPIVVEGFGKESVLVAADRADLGSGAADVDMAADLALEDDDDTIFDGELVRLQGFEKSLVSGFVAGFDLADHLELRSDLGESFLPGDPGKLGIHLGLLVVLAGSGILKVDFGGGDASAMEIFEPELGMLALVLCRLEEKLGEFGVAFLGGDFGIIAILRVGLALSGKGGLEILLGLGTLQIFHRSDLPP